MNYQNITSPDINNGKGCRVTLWVSGCPHRCPGCHNSETWEDSFGQPFDNLAFEELFNKLNKSYITGLTISGGEPLDLSNTDKLGTILNIVKKFRDSFGNSKNIWIYTGNLLNDLYTNSLTIEILKNTDYLVDGRFDIKLRNVSLPFRGSENQIIYKKNSSGIFEPDDEFIN